MIQQSVIGMRGNVRLENVYDMVLQTIRSCVQEMPFQCFADVKQLIIIAINDEGMVKKFLQRLFEVNPDIEVILVAQPKMAEILQNTVCEKIRVLEWKGMYTKGTAAYIKDRLYGLEPDGFLHFCDQPVNLRNRNLLDIAEVFDCDSAFGIYSVDYEGTLYQYHNIALYNHGIHMYEEMNQFIGLALDTTYSRED